MQEEIKFETDSPINTDKLTGQNKAIYEHLLSGKTINCIQAQDMYVTALNSRIADLRNKFGVKIYDRFVNIGTGRSMVKEYSLTKF